MLVNYLAKRARRILAGTQALSPEERIFPGYISFENGIRPVWWKDNLAPETWGTVLGVHEHEPGRRVGAIVVTEMGLGVFSDVTDAIWLPYDSIQGWIRCQRSRSPFRCTFVPRPASASSSGFLA